MRWWWNNKIENCDDRTFSSSNLTISCSSSSIRFIEIFSRSLVVLKEDFKKEWDAIVIKTKFWLTECTLVVFIQCDVQFLAENWNFLLELFYSFHTFISFLSNKMSMNYCDFNQSFQETQQQQQQQKKTREKTRTRCRVSKISANRTNVFINPLVFILSRLGYGSSRIRQMSWILPL